MLPAESPIPANNALAFTASDELRLQSVPITSLKAYGRKARLHTRDQIQKLAESIRTFGFSVPILVDDDERILAGHARLEAARLVGMTHVPVVVLSHLNPAQKRAFILAENRLAELAGWDRDALRVELEEITALDIDFNVAVIGFNEAEIDAIVLGGVGNGEQGNDTPEAPHLPVSAQGDLWLLGEQRLFCGDALDPSSVARVLQGDVARVDFTDPPYNVPIAGHVTSNRSHGEFVMASGEMSDDEFIAFLASTLDRIVEALAPGGLAYVCMDWRHLRHVLAASEGKGLELLNLIVWDKKTGGMGSFYRSRHELIFLMKKSGEKHTNRVELGRNGRDRANVWAYEGVGGFGAQKAKAREMHPTVKPLALVRDAILDSTARGDVVLDLFSGSGTTLIAAHESRRRGRAIELDPKYADVAVIRWQDFSGCEARLAETGETFLEVRNRREQAASIQAGG